MVYLLKMVIFHGYVSHNQMVYSKPNISVVLFTGLWSIDEPQWIEHLQEFRNWKHAMDL